MKVIINVGSIIINIVDYPNACIAPSYADKTWEWLNDSSAQFRE